MKIENYKNLHTISAVGTVYKTKDGNNDILDSWNINRDSIQIESLADKKELLKAKKFIIGYLNKLLFDKVKLNNKLNRFTIDYCTINASQFCDKNNNDVSTDYIKSSENGENELYLQDIVIQVEIDGQLIEEDDLIIILNF